MEANNNTKRKIGAPAGRRNAGKKRAVLLETASQLFIDKGHDKTTMDDIASAANVAKGTLYHYFKSKADLLDAMRTDFEKEIMNIINPAIAVCEADNYVAQVKAWVDGAVKGYFELNEIHDVVIYGSGMPFRNTMADAEITKSLHKIIADGANAGAWVVNDTHFTAVTMFYSYRGGCDEAILGTVAKEEVPEKLKELFLRILGV